MNLKITQIIAIILIIIGVILSSTNIKDIFIASRKKIAKGIKEGLIAMIGWGIVFTLVAYVVRRIGWIMPIMMMRIIMILFLSLFIYLVFTFEA